MTFRVFDSVIFRAVRRAGLPIITIALTYFIFLLIGLGMVHAGSRFALDRRDRLVRHGEMHDPAAIALQGAQEFKAFSIDFGRDLYRAVIKTLEGLTVVVPYPGAAYAGWYRGILSVDNSHESEFADPLGAVYYLLYHVLQILSSALAAAAGVNLTLACFRSRSWYQGAKWLFIPKEAVFDLLRIYLLVVPLIFLATCWKYFFQ